MNPNHEHACGCEHTHEEESQYNKYEDALSKISNESEGR